MIFRKIQLFFSEIPADGPVQLLARLQFRVGTLRLDFDEGLAGVDIDLDLGFARSGVRRSDVGELLGEDEAVVMELEPALAVHVDLAVLVGDVDVQSGTVLIERDFHQVERGDILGLCVELGLQVPEEVAVLGIGNDTFLCENQTVPISSVIDNPEERGYKGAALLDRMIDGEQPPRTPVVIPCRDIAVRRSTDTVCAENPILRQALSVIKDNLINPPSAVQLAERLGVSRATLDRLFNCELKRSFRSEILRRRLLKATSLLRESDLTVKAIAAECGFCNSGHFVNVFRKKCGNAPDAWRRSINLR